MTEALATSLDCLDERGRGLRLEFFKHGDRFAHRIYLVDSSDVVLQLESVEGDDEDMAPPSPPFAELHQQGETLFLTGATTLGHWSMSVEAREGKLEFDVACRAKPGLDSLGNTYSVLSQEYEVELQNAVQETTPVEILKISTRATQSAAQLSTIQWRYSIYRKKK